MTDAEKNEVLAKFAGFRYKLSASENNHYWIGPNGQTVDCDESGDALLPDLLHSLDAQAKWLVPKLNETLKHDGWSASWTPWFPPERQWGVNIGRRGRDEEYFGATLAEAFAEAILSLIGKVKP